jgi:DNA helicase-2/ATP-dependent DNA helicase PcrA
VFYRTNAQSRVLEEQFMRSGVPYKVIGGTRFYDRREVKDAIAYLRCVVNPIDEVSLKRVVNNPKRGVGDSSIQKLDQFAATEGITFFDALRRAPEAGVSGKAYAGINEFVRAVETAGGVTEGGPAAMLESVLTASGYLEALHDEGTIEAEGRAENLSELVGVAAGFESVDEFLEQVALVADTDEIDDDESSVMLMTLHAAKGLEFPIVFLIGMEDGVFPHLRTLAEPDQMEEERRLAYVGITRARERLHVSSAWSRMLHGTTQYNPPSRFLDEIPAELVNESGQRRRRRSSFSGDRWDHDHGGSSSSWNSGGSWGSSSSSRPSGSGGDALRPKPPTQSGADQLGLRVGDDVAHAKWGEGVVLDVRGQGDSAEAVVRFPDVGEKNLLLAWAPLSKITRS